MGVTGFNHLTLRVRNLNRSLPFYCDLLGMKLVHRGRKDVYLSWGKAWICLLERSEERELGGLGMDHVAFSIDLHGFEELVKKLDEHSVIWVRKPIKRGGGWSAQFKDPDGIVLELFTGTLEKRMENWK